MLHAFPHWNWEAGDKVDIWAYSNAASVELFVNGMSLGRQKMTQFSHVEWQQVPFAAGGYHTVAYDAAGKQVGTSARKTTGAPAALRASVRDGVGEKLFTGCNDYGLVQVEVVDADGLVVPGASDVVTLSISGTKSSAIEGSANGDPAGDYNNKLPMHPAYHGLMLGVVKGGDDIGTVTVAASAPGLASGSVQMAVVDGSGLDTAWCRNLPEL